jgi:hypothetical protein
MVFLKIIIQGQFFLKKFNPQMKKNGSQVNIIIKKINEDKREHSMKVLLNTLGNLAILGPKNQPLKNKSWNSKKHGLVQVHIMKLRLVNLTNGIIIPLKTEGQRCLNTFVIKFKRDLCLMKIQCNKYCLILIIL